MGGLRIRRRFEIPVLKHIIIAYSGGADSTALLLMAQERFAGRVSAIHVHHGLQAAADDFAAHCEAFCKRLDVPLQICHVNAKNAAGQSPEDAARKARYTAISEAVKAHFLVLKPLKSRVENAGEAPENIAFENSENTEIWLAQHADDQVETLLLALSRGAGVDGMAGMAASFERLGCQWRRPFIDADSPLSNPLMGSQDIRAWLAGRGLKAREPFSENCGQGWVEDPTNASPAYTRNRIRAELLPALQKVFPQYRETFARTARNMAKAQAELAGAALETIAEIGNPPRIQALQKLSREAQANALRHWLKTEHGAMGSEAQMNELLSQIAACQTRRHRIDIKFANGKIRRQQDALSFELK